MLAARPAGQAARVPRRLPAVTLTVIPPAARPRHAQAARAPSPPALAPRPAPPRPRAGAGGAGPHRRPGAAADHRPATADAGAWPPEASLLATAPHPVLRARTPTILHGPVAGAAAPALTASSRGAAAREPRPYSAGPPIIAVGIPAPAGVRPWPRRSCRAESGKAPPCMRWRGLARPRRARPASWLRRRCAPPAGARYPREWPVSRLLPRSRRRPRVVPVSSGESISTASASTAQGPAASHFLFFRYPRRNPQKAGSYPHFTAVIHGFTNSLPAVLPGVSRRTPEPLSSHAIGRSFHSDFGVITG